MAVDRAIQNALLEKDARNVSLEGADNFGFTLKVKFDGEEKIVGVAYKLDDVGAWSENQLVTRIGSLIFSPKYRLWQVQDDLVGMFNMGKFQGGRINKIVNDAVKEHLSGIDKISMGRIDNLLLKGDAAGKEYTYSDMVLQGIDGIKYTEAEHRAYAGLRDTFNKLHGVMNYDVLQRMKIAGTKLVDIDGVQYAGKAAESVEEAYNLIVTGKQIGRAHV